ncbi:MULTISPECIES: LemA family protein [Kandleria]|jgi:LemA protein|uniref:Epitope LemA n=2 Tax=Kandleria vitulina TaxID=1630 RepID=A0A0R2HB13_9FIRM|nr:MULTISPECIES: LemA family protein [Kandleria]KRN47260.1 epitope LemA [Kandleria vitulina DSM 20405]MBP3276887.1 LemA family protein [Kandleria sp.]MEE0989551.1 LemA family protein [Kandleria vitulina]SDL85868.1 LemA protein [Kandleria vitulina]SDW43791.1 LemA protein [Kandleria vitulina]
MILIVIIAIIAVIVLWCISTYNSLVKLRNKAQTAWAQVDVVLKRRADLIPNLVETVKGYAKHEKETLQAVIAARNNYTNASTVEEQIETSNQLTQAIGRLFAVAEAYPDLKANENFIQLQNELTETENKIQYARQFYNDDVNQYKNKLEMFPSSLVASFGHFERLPYFEAEASAKEAPHVEF